MSSKIIITNRVSRVFANILKMFGYVFHFFFPKKRFTIPKYSPSKIKAKTEYKIPRVLWQTNYTNKVTLPVYMNYLFNRLMSLSFDYRYASDDDRVELIKKYGTKRELEAFLKLTNGASQADFWRLFVLNQKGGVYMDIDAQLVWPLGKIIEPNDEHIFLMTKHNYSNYFMASASGNEILKECINMIVKNIEEKNIGGGVYDLTGPTVLNKVIGDKKVKHRHNKITCIQGTFTNEYFQYIDKKEGKWTKAKKEDLIKDA